MTYNLNNIFIADRSGIYLSHTEARKGTREVLSKAFDLGAEHRHNVGMLLRIDACIVSLRAKNGIRRQDSEHNYAAVIEGRRNGDRHDSGKDYFLDYVHRIFAVVDRIVVGILIVHVDFLTPD